MHSFALHKGAFKGWHLCMDAAHTAAAGLPTWPATLQAGAAQRCMARQRWPGWGLVPRPVTDTFGQPSDAGTGRRPSHLQNVAVSLACFCFPVQPPDQQSEEHGLDNRAHAGTQVQPLHAQAKVEAEHEGGG